MVPLGKSDKQPKESYEHDPPIRSVDHGKGVNSRVGRFWPEPDTGILEGARNSLGLYSPSSMRTFGFQTRLTLLGVQASTPKRLPREKTKGVSEEKAAQCLLIAVVCFGCCSLGALTAVVVTGLNCLPYGCGSKIGARNGTLVNRNMD